MRRGIRETLRWSAVAVLLWLLPAVGGAAEGAAGPPAPGGESAEGDAEHSASRLTDEHIPLQVDSVPQRPKFLIELGNPYLGTGRIKPGFELPTGAVWQPSFIAFGALRTAVQTFNDGPDERTEWANRLDLFGNLQLSGSERLVIGFRNLDQEGRFSGYVFEPDVADPSIEEFNSSIQSLYFEGDFGEIFPNLDREDFGRTDIGFSIGRQPLLFQEGMLINDSIDGLGLTRNTLLPKNTSNFRITFFLGLDDIDRNFVEDESATLFAILTSTDRRRSTIDFDLAWVGGDALTGDLLAVGVSAVQRIGKTNSSFRVLGSFAGGDETPSATDGVLLFSELSWTPAHSHDLVYFNSFAAFDQYSPAASDPAVGGPLGRAGITFAAVGLGSYGAPLSSTARDVAGAAVGYQKFLGHGTRRQLVGEIGLRTGTASGSGDSAALGLRYQAAMGRRMVWVVDAFGGTREGSAPGIGDDTLWGGRVEFQLKF